MRYLDSNAYGRLYNFKGAYAGLRFQLELMLCEDKLILVGW
jgi:hypothetical protein